MINYALKYSPKVDERFTLEALSKPSTNQEYDWIGVETVKIYSVPTVDMVDYTASGSNRYGNPDELDNSVQTLTLRKDRSFSFTIDRKSFDDTMMVMEVGKALARELVEVTIPEIDAYVFQQEAFNAGNYNTTTPSKSNVYEEFLGMNGVLDNNYVPTVGRIAYVTPKVYNYLKLDPSFIKTGDMSLQVSYKGIVGEVDGVAIIKVPERRMPVGCNIIITHPLATVAPVKLESYRVFDNPPGINGWLCEGRFRYDAFVLNNKKNAIVVNAAASTTHTITFDANGADDTRKIPQAVTGFDGGKFKAPSCRLTKLGKTFKEWNTLADGSGTTVAVGADITISADSTLYAIYNS